MRDRKGEYRKELLDLRKAGFARVRVDGEMRDLAEDITLKKTLKHSIEVVVDRLVVKPGLAKRLADSLETAFRHGGDVVMVEELEADGRGTMHLFSQQLACPDCGVSYPELAPRMFSFNSPHGACSACSGLGVQRSFDPDRVVPDESLSLAAGAIAPWARRQEAWAPLLDALARHLGISLDTPWSELPARARDAILRGTGGEAVTVAMKRGRRVSRPFEGVLAMLERRWRETESNPRREEMEAWQSERPCEDCGGSRLKPEAKTVRLGGRSIAGVTALSIGAARAWVTSLELSPQQVEIARLVLREISERLGFLSDVGLDYLSLDRAAGTLSGGEGQRIRLATQIGSSLVGVLYVLDEPSIGLHQRDNERLLATLERLRDLGNSVLVVEHDRDTMLAADHLLDMGPGAGRLGGAIVSQGTPAEVARDEGSLTGDYLSGRRSIPLPPSRRAGTGWSITVKGARQHNLRGVDVSIPLGTLTCVTCVSGSCKSSLVVDTLYPWLARRLHGSREPVGECDAIEGFQLVDKVVDIDQAPIGRT
ncbi:MAG: excinuclease ABC subunit UvrA, partial [Alphaproteobacteria bacterium]